MELGSSPYAIEAFHESSVPPAAGITDQYRLEATSAWWE